MKDGHVNKCKECNLTDVYKHRLKNIEKIRNYDKKRGNRHKKGYIKDYRERFPKKYKAHCLVNNAIRDKKLFKDACVICGNTETVRAHHDDYDRPLNIKWLCAAHHKQWHEKNGEALNQS